MHSQDKTVEIPMTMVVSETQSSQFIPNISTVKKEAGQKRDAELSYLISTTKLAEGSCGSFV